MVSGGTQGITSDCGDCNVDTANLADQLERAGILDTDLSAGRLPRFVFVTPDLAHDMHGTGTGDAAVVRAADDWLRALYGKLARLLGLGRGHRVVVTWDEGGGGGRGPAAAAWAPAATSRPSSPAPDPTSATIPALISGATP